MKTSKNNLEPSLVTDVETHNDILYLLAKIAPNLCDIRDMLADAMVRGDAKTIAYIEMLVKWLSNPSEITVPYQRWAKEALSRDPDLRRRNDQYRFRVNKIYNGIRDLHMKSKLSIREVSKRAGVAPNTLLNIIHRRAVPQREKIDAIAQVYGTTFENLLKLDAIGGLDSKELADNFKHCMENRDGACSDQPKPAQNPSFDHSLHMNYDEDPST